MSELSISGLLDRIPLDARRVTALSAVVLASLAAAGCSPIPGSQQSKTKERSGKVGLFIGCPPGTRAKIEDVVQPEDSDPASAALTCDDDANGDPVQPIGTDLGPVRPFYDGTRPVIPPGLSGISNVAEFVVNFSYADTGFGDPSCISLRPALGSTPFSFVEATGVDRIGVEPVLPIGVAA